MFQRATGSVIAVAAAGAAAVLVVFATGFAIYALIEPLIGAAGAAASVAAIAAAGVGVYALVAGQRVKAREREAEDARAALLEALPLGLGEIARERPIATLAASVLGGVVAARHPRVIRDVITILARLSER